MAKSPLGTPLSLPRLPLLTTCVRRAPTLAIMQAPPALGTLPATSASFVVAATPAAPGIPTNVSAVVSNDDAGSVVVARFPSSPLGVFNVQGLVPGSNYTLRASCLDALRSPCGDVVHSWRSAACPRADARPPSGLTVVSLALGVRFVSWTASGSDMEYAVDGGPWTHVPRVHPETAASGVLVGGCD